MTALPGLIEDLGLIQYPGYINIDHTLWVPNGAQFTGTFTAQAPGIQPLDSKTTAPQHIILNVPTGPSDPSLFRILPDAYNTIECLKDGLYNLSCSFGISCNSVPTSLNWATIMANITIYDTDGTTVLYNFKDIRPVQALPLGASYTLSVVGVASIFVGQFVNVTYQDYTNSTSSNQSLTIYQTPALIDYPAIPFLSLTLLNKIENQAAVTADANAHENVLTVSEPVAKKGKYNLS